MKKTTNSRAAESQQAIVNALLLLMEKEKFCTITITQIIQEAQLSRKTFYRNFLNKQDVLQHLSNLLFIEFCHRLDKKAELTNSWITECYFYFWYDKRGILQVLNNQKLLYFIFEVHIDKIHRLYQKFPCSSEMQHNNFRHSIIIGSYFSVLIQWLDDGFRIDPKEMSQTYSLIMKNLGENML